MLRLHRAPSAANFSRRLEISLPSWGETAARDSFFQLRGGHQIQGADDHLAYSQSLKLFGQSFQIGKTGAQQHISDMHPGSDLS